MCALSVISRGRPRIHRVLRAAGTWVSRRRVERLMREAGGRARAMKLYRRIPGLHGFFTSVPNRQLDRLATGPDQLWVGDITYLKACSSVAHEDSLLRQVVRLTRLNPEAFWNAGRSPSLHLSTPRAVCITLRLSCGPRWRGPCRDGKARDGADSQLQPVVRRLRGTV